MLQAVLLLIKSIQIILYLAVKYYENQFSLEADIDTLLETDKDTRARAGSTSDRGS